jgi:hypothetical protein
VDVIGAILDASSLILEMPKLFCTTCRSREVVFELHRFTVNSASVIRIVDVVGEILKMWRPSTQDHWDTENRCTAAGWVRVDCGVDVAAKILDTARLLNTGHGSSISVSNWLHLA